MLRRKDSFQEGVEAAEVQKDFIRQHQAWLNGKGTLAAAQRASERSQEAMVVGEEGTCLQRLLFRKGLFKGAGQLGS